MKFFSLQCILICLLLCNGKGLWAQSKDSSVCKAAGSRLGYSYNGLHHLEAGFGKGRAYVAREMIGIIGYRDAFINLGYGFNSDHSVLTTKIGYEIMVLVVGARVSLVNYTNFRQNQLCLLPEIGICYGPLTATYGYTFRLSENYFNLKGHTLSAGAVIPLYIK